LEGIYEDSARLWDLLCLILNGYRRKAERFSRE